MKLLQKICSGNQGLLPNMLPNMLVSRSQHILVGPALVVTSSRQALSMVSHFGFTVYWDCGDNYASKRK